MGTDNHSNFNAGSSSFPRKELMLGVKESKKFLDMGTLYPVPVFLKADGGMRVSLGNELQLSPFIWVKYQKPVIRDGIDSVNRFRGEAPGSLYILTNNWKFHMFLGSFNNGGFFLSVSGKFAKKQSDTINAFKDYIQVRHCCRFTLSCNGDNVLWGTIPTAASDFLQIIRQKCGELRQYVPEETEPETEAEMEDTNQPDSLVEFCNLHSQLIDFEEEYDKSKGYDFTYSRFQPTEHSDNTKGVTYRFDIDGYLKEMDRESIEGLSVLVKKDENEEGLKAWIIDADIENNHFYIKFNKAAGYGEIPPAGYIKKNERNIGFEIQRTAFRNILGGTAANKSIYRNIVQKNFTPISFRQPVEIKKLSKSQERAVNMAVNTEDLLLVQGPPGTGKTEIIITMLELFLKQGKKILISSKNNLAVDNVLQKCIEKGISCIRLGRPESVKLDIVKSVLVDVYSITVQKGIEARAREYHDRIRAEKEESAGKLSFLESIKIRLEESFKKYTELRKLKVELVFFKAIKLIRFIPGFTAKYDQLLLKRQEAEQEIENIRGDIENKAKVLGIASEIDPKKKSFMDRINKEYEGYTRRIGDAEKKLPISGQWIKELQGRQDVLSEISLNDVNVIGATCIGVSTNRLFTNMEYDVAIIDEAGQITLHDVIVPISKAKKTILIGDHIQLPPNADDDFMKKAAERFTGMDIDLDDIYKVSLFEKLFKDMDDRNKVMLDTQYRMHMDIAAPISELFYEGKYKTGCKSEHREINLGGLKDPICFIDTHNIPDKQETVTVIEKQNVYTNRAEAEIIAKILSDRFDFLNEGITVANYNGEKKCTFDDVGIITPYKAQIDCIKKALCRALEENVSIDHAAIRNVVSRIEIDTVDSFQGRDKQIILFSFVRSNPEHRIGFLNELRRFNVTVTRAKRLLILVGDSETLTKTGTRNSKPDLKPPREYFSSFIAYCRNKGYYHEANGEAVPL